MIEKELIEKYKKHAEKNGFELNPNQKIIEHIIKGLIKNKKGLGKYYCPCRRIHTDETVCPCIYHKKEIKDQGHCHCFLFVKKN